MNCIPFNFLVYTNKQTNNHNFKFNFTLYTVKRYVSSVCRCQFNLTVKSKRVYAKMKNTIIMVIIILNVEKILNPDDSFFHEIKVK